MRRVESTQDPSPLNQILTFTDEVRGTGSDPSRKPRQNFLITRLQTPVGTFQVRPSYYLYTCVYFLYLRRGDTHVCPTYVCT